MDTLQDRITGFWSAVASGYEAHEGNVPAPDSDEHQAWRAAFAERLPPAPADVLDIATGTGFAALIAAEQGHRVTGIDLAEPMLAEAKASAARRGLGLTLRLGDAIDPPFAPASFDAITCRHLIWTLRDPLDAFRAWRRLLRPGGRVVAFDGFHFEPEDESAPEPEGFFESFYGREQRRQLPAWRFTHETQVAELFRQAGFTDVTLSTLNDIHRAALAPSSDKPGYALVASI